MLDNIQYTTDKIAPNPQLILGTFGKVPLLSPVANAIIFYAHMCNIPALATPNDVDELWWRITYLHSLGFYLYKNANGAEVTEPFYGDIEAMLNLTVQTTYQPRKNWMQQKIDLAIEHTNKKANNAQLKFATTQQLNQRQPLFAQYIKAETNINVSTTQNDVKNTIAASIPPLKGDTANAEGDVKNESNKTTPEQPTTPLENISGNDDIELQMLRNMDRAKMSDAEKLRLNQLLMQENERKVQAEKAATQTTGPTDWIGKPEPTPKYSPDWWAWHTAQELKDNQAKQEAKRQEMINKGLDPTILNKIPDDAFGRFNLFGNKPKETPAVQPPVVVAEPVVISQPATPIIEEQPIPLMFEAPATHAERALMQVVYVPVPKKRNPSMKNSATKKRVSKVVKNTKTEFEQKLGKRITYRANKRK